MARAFYIIVTALVLVTLRVPAAASAGSFFPDSEIQLTLPQRHLAYLGLGNDSSSFRLSDIQAEFLLINVYSLYCSPCQRDAPAFNQMYEKIAELGMDGRIKFIGIAAGNTVREMDFWRKRYTIQFPLIPDEDYGLHKLFGDVGTPFFVLIRIDGPDRLKIVFSREGAFDDAESFFATILLHANTGVAAND